MANTYTWDFPNLEVHNSAQNGHDDVIKTIHWTMTATSDTADSDGNYPTTSLYGSIALDTPDTGDSSFVAFDSVTKDNCKTWVLNNLTQTEAELQTTADNALTAQQTPETRDDKPSGW